MQLLVIYKRKLSALLPVISIPKMPILYYEEQRVGVERPSLWTREELPGPIPTSSPQHQSCASETLPEPRGQALWWDGNGLSIPTMLPQFCSSPAEAGWHVSIEFTDSARSSPWS